MRKASDHSTSDATSHCPTLAGQILVASPYLANPVFARSVILLLQHQPQGSAGVVLNRSAGHSIQQLWKHVGRQTAVADRPFHVGGPVPGPIVALHRQPELAEFQLRPGLFLATARDRLEQLVQRTDEPFRVFVGHAAWQPGQLQRELAAGAWMLLPLGDLEVLGDESRLWRDSIQRVGESVLEKIGPAFQRSLPVERN